MTELFAKRFSVGQQVGIEGGFVGIPTRSRQQRPLCVQIEGAEGAVADRGYPSSVNYLPGDAERSSIAAGLE